jgi:hypothetical protein
MKRIVRISTGGRPSRAKATTTYIQKTATIPLDIIEKLNWQNIKIAMFETFLDSNGKGYLVITEEDE